MKNDLISVIVPIYKVENYLHECIDSLLNQTYANLEIILVDDGSPDKCPQICDEYASKDDRIKVIHKPNGGVMSAWITGVNNSLGNYICFLDSDDYAKENFVEKLYAGITKHNADVCVANYIRHFENRDKGNFGIQKELLIETGKNIENCACLFGESYPGLTHKLSPCRWDKIYKKQLILDAIPFLNPKISMADDVNLNFYVFSHCKKVALIPDYLIYYRIWSNSMTKTKKDYWPSYNMALKQLFLINDSAPCDLKQIIYNGYMFYWVAASLKFYFQNKQYDNARKLMNSEVVNTCLIESKPKGIKRKVFFWILKKKNLKLTKFAFKFLK